MTYLMGSTLGSVLDNYADVIEGGNRWRGSGTAFIGIPGLYSMDNGLASGDDTPLTVVTAPSTSTLTVGSTYNWRRDRWISANGPAFFMYFAAGAAAGVRRKITDYTVATNLFTVGTVFTTKPAIGNTFQVLQGFKRMPATMDLLSAPDGFDRFFDLKIEAGKATGWAGSGLRTYETTLALRLRLLKYGKMHDSHESVLANMAILREAITKRDHYDATYVRAMTPMDEFAAIKVEDDTKIIIEDRYRMFYRIYTSLT